MSSWKPPTSIFEVPPRWSWDNPPPFITHEEKPPDLLDKEGLAAHILSCAQEHFMQNGVKRYAIEARDRVSLLKLYAEVMGFTGAKADTSQNNFVNNEMKVVLVKPEATETKELKTIETKVEKLTNVTPLRIKAV